MKGIIRKIKDTICQIETMGGDLLDAVRMVQPYGFASHPEAGAEAVLVGGEENAIIIVQEDKRYRIPLKSGEVAIYHKGGDRVVFRDGNVVEMVTKNLKITTETCAISNASGELLGLLSEALGVISRSKVSTMMGPQPLLSAAVDLPVLRQKIDTFLGDKHAQ